VGHFSHLMINFHRHPDVSHVSKVGEPTLVPPPETSATDVARQAQQSLTGPSVGGTSTLTIQPVGAGGPPPAANQPVPRAASGDNSSAATDSSIPELKPRGDAAQPATQVPQPAPAQVNEAAGDSQSSANTGSQQGTSSSSAQGSNDAQSSSKKKKKRKLWPF